MMIPDPGVIVIEVVRRTTEPGVTEADMIRWVGVAVGVAGVVLAIPDGIAAAWRWVTNKRDRGWALVRRVLRRPRQTHSLGGFAARGGLSLGGNAYAHPWRQWREDAKDDEKVDILHHQVEILREMIYESRRRSNRAAQDLSNDIRDAESRVTDQLGLLTSEMRGERSHASRVDARGFGPIAGGIIMTGLPDELAAIAVVGWAFLAMAVVWTALTFPGWLKDYKQALRHDSG